jgi:hypothetical protein
MRHVEGLEAVEAVEAVERASPHHPWRRFGELTDWSLRWAELPPGVMGLTCHRTRTVTLALGMSQAERRCTIAHETQHIVRGPVPAGVAHVEERAIDRLVATLLVPDTLQVADALARAGGQLEAAADELWVDDYLLEVRLGSLTDAQRALVARRVSDALE